MPNHYWSDAIGCRSYNLGEAPMKYTVIAFDPGGTTGYCVLENPSGQLVTMGQVTGSDQAQGESILRLLEKYRKGTFVVIESYRIFQKALEAHTNSRVQPVEMIGRIKATCDSLRIPYKEQPPFLKKFFTVRRLKWYGAYKVGQTHANDAACHALYWLVFTQKVLTVPKE